MNAGIKKVICFVVGGIVVTTAISWWMEAHRDDEAKRALEETRRELRAQGFKTELSDFDFKTDDATRARAAVLGGGGWTSLNDRHLLESSSMPEVSPDTVRVIWKESLLISKRGAFDWSDFHPLLDPHRAELDAACLALQTGPVRFEPNVSQGENMWGEMAGRLRLLVPELGTRALLELHDGNEDAAWTNLMAMTRIVTAWQPEPTEFAYIIRAGFADITFAATWQTLQCGNWPDARLAALQWEWESANFFTNLSETAAFHRVEAADRSRLVTTEAFAGDFSISGVAREMFQNPAQAYADVKESVDRASYRGREQLKDEKNLLLFFRDRELELRKAVQLPTWAAMRGQPGITNAPAFKSWYPPMRDYLQFDALYRSSMLVDTADAEARRRVLVTAIALERYRVRRGMYPAALAPLAPEFLKTVPVDFMNGQPLHYRLMEDGHFVLYSVGPDCVDDGGKMPAWNNAGGPAPLMRLWAAVTNEDIVWPRPYAASARK